MADNLIALLTLSAVGLAVVLSAQEMAGALGGSVLLAMLMFALGIAASATAAISSASRLGADPRPQDLEPNRAVHAMVCLVGGLGTTLGVLGMITTLAYY